MQQPTIAAPRGVLPNVVFPGHHTQAGAAPAYQRWQLPRDHSLPGQMRSPFGLPSLIPVIAPPTSTGYVISATPAAVPLPHASLHSTNSIQGAERAARESHRAPFTKIVERKMHDHPIAPPKWKIFLLNLVPAYIGSSLIVPLVTMWFPHCPFLISNGMSTLLLVSLLTYLVTPIEMQLCHGWLYGRRGAHGNDGAHKDESSSPSARSRTQTAWQKRTLRFPSIAPRAVQ